MFLSVFFRKAIKVSYFLFPIFLLAACGGQAQEPEPEQFADEITLFNWDEDLPSEVFDQFAEEYGITVNLVIYESSGEADKRLRAGEVFDVMVIENQFIPGLADAGLLAKIDFTNVPNFRNISANFRDLAYDPSNTYSVPYSWGTTGLVVRTDLVSDVDQWADLWDPALMNQVVYFATEQRNVMAVALKSLGYSINTDNPDEVREAADKLIELGQVAKIEDVEAYSTAPTLVAGEAAIAIGWAYDVVEAQEAIDTVEYILPAEGTMLWGDNYVLPAASTKKRTAELFLDFLLRPEVTAQIVEYNHYPTPNEGAMALLDPEILDNPLIFPPNESLAHAELFLPLDSAAQLIWDTEWQRYLDALGLDNE
jgi:spermidine/putrescine transport system substrate-binding protein